jgi:hypothetical protein
MGAAARFTNKVPRRTGKSCPEQTRLRLKLNTKVSEDNFCSTWAQSSSVKFDPAVIERRENSFNRRGVNVLVKSGEGPAIRVCEAPRSGPSIPPGVGNSSTGYRHSENRGLLQRASLFLLDLKRNFFGFTHRTTDSLFFAECALRVHLKRLYKQAVDAQSHTPS